MRNRYCQIVLLFIYVISCFGVENDIKNESPKHTKLANKVLKTLYRASNHKPLLGHQDALLYGQSWWIDEKDSLYEKSDVYEVCGEHPFILGLDLGRIETGGERNIDRCLFKQMKEAAIAHHNRGGIITISWHMDNPVTDSTAWDRTASNVVHKVLNDSLLHKKYLQWLDRGAEFLNQLIDPKGGKIPILFRPFHECNIEAFWWSPKSCSDEEFIALWRMTYDYFVNKKQMKQLLWVYSPYNVKTEEELEERYPGDEFVDVIGYERYQLGAFTYKMGADRFAEGARNGIDVTLNFAKPREKVVAFTETGFPGIPYDKWWTEALGRAIKKKPIAYVHLWRNGLSKTHYHGPCLNSKSTQNFIRFTKEYKIKLLKKNESINYNPPLLRRK